MGLMEVLFAFVLVAAVVAVLFKPKQGGVIVLAVAMGGAFWYLGGLMEWHPLFVVWVVFAAAAVKIVDEVSGAGVLESEFFLTVADMVLTRWTGGGGPRPPMGGGQGGGQQGGGGGGPGPIWDDED